MKKTAFILLGLLIYSANVYATHVWGSEISYRPISSGSSKYEIGVKIYRFCGGVSLDTSDFDVNVRCAGSSTSTPLPLSMTLVSIKDVSSQSGSSGRCTPPNTFGTGIGLEEILFLDTVDFGSSPFSNYSSCGETIIELSACCRNSSITTGGSNANYYNYASIFLVTFLRILQVLLPLNPFGIQWFINQ